MGHLTCSISFRERVQRLILNTTPASKRMPPVGVVPYKFPAESKITPASGSPPTSPPGKAYRTVSFPVLSSWKTTPHPAFLQSLRFPPYSVVPYRFPDVSRIRSEAGRLPPFPPKVRSTVSFPAALSLKTVPSPPPP